LRLLHLPHHPQVICHGALMEVRWMDRVMQRENWAVEQASPLKRQLSDQVKL